jgi:hypothetical protein
MIAALGWIAMAIAAASTPVAACVGAIWIWVWWE